MMASQDKLTAKQAKIAVLAEPFSYHSAATLMEREVGATIRAFEGRKHCSKLPKNVGEKIGIHKSEKKASRFYRIYEVLTEDWQSSLDISGKLAISRKSVTDAMPEVMQLFDDVQRQNCIGSNKLFYRRIK